MSREIEDVLRDLAKQGRFSHLSLASTHDGQFEAAWRGVAGQDHRIVKHPDPVCALRGAMTGRPGDVPKPARRKAASDDGLLV